MALSMFPLKQELRQLLLTWCLHNADPVRLCCIAVPAPVRETLHHGALVPAAVIEGPSTMCSLITAGMGSLRQVSRPVLICHVRICRTCKSRFQRISALSSTPSRPALPWHRYQVCSAVGWALGLIKTGSRHSCCAEYWSGATLATADLRLRPVRACHIGSWDLHANAQWPRRCTWTLTSPDALGEGMEPRTFDFGNMLPSLGCNSPV